MKRAALGFRMHSGWGVLVAVTVDANSIEVLDRRRIAVTAPGDPGASQPYHYAAKLETAKSEIHIAHCLASSERLALAAIEELLRDLHERNFRVVGSALLLASGRALPPLPNILASHPLIHTAEGEFFRETVRRVCERLKIPVTAIKERELDKWAGTAFGSAASRIQRRISGLGTSLGPPWTKDHKSAALAASVVLAGK